MNNCDDIRVKQICLLSSMLSYVQCCGDVPAAHLGKDITHKTLETMCNTRARPQQRWKRCTNGFNIVGLVALRFGDHGAKELGVVGLKN